jgi:hypothetical protein
MITQITKAELPFFEEITEKVSRMPQPDIPMNHIFPEGMENAGINTEDNIFCH